MPSQAHIETALAIDGIRLNLIRKGGGDNTQQVIRLWPQGQEMWTLKAGEERPSNSWLYLQDDDAQAIHQALTEHYGEPEPDETARQRAKLEEIDRQFVIDAHAARLKAEAERDSLRAALDKLQGPRSTLTATEGQQPAPTAGGQGANRGGETDESGLNSPPERTETTLQNFGAELAAAIIEAVKEAAGIITEETKPEPKPYAADPHTHPADAQQAILATPGRKAEELSRQPQSAEAHPTQGPGKPDPTADQTPQAPPTHTPPQDDTPAPPSHDPPISEQERRHLGIPPSDLPEQEYPGTGEPGYGDPLPDLSETRVSLIELADGTLVDPFADPPLEVRRANTPTTPASTPTKQAETVIPAPSQGTEPTTPAKQATDPPDEPDQPDE